MNKLVILVVLSGLLALSLPAAQASSTGLGEDTFQACGKWQNHRFEACAAYFLNDAHWSLQPYYKYVYSDSIFSGLKYRFQLNYQAAARRKLVSWANVSAWTKGSTNNVDGPDIRITDAESSLACNRGVLHTVESWRVADENGKLLYNKDGQIYTVVLRRVLDSRFEFTYRGKLYILHAWVVANIYLGRRSIALC